MYMIVHAHIHTHTHTHTHTPVEDTVAEVYKDFEVAALVDPDRMKRRSLIGSSDSASIGSRESTQH